MGVQQRLLAAGQPDTCSKIHDAARQFCEAGKNGSGSDPCGDIIGEAKKYCERGTTGGVPDTGGGGMTDGASQHVKDLADWLINAIQHLIAPSHAWAPSKTDSVVYAPFLWLGQHLAVAIFVCIVAVCGLTAWQGAPRLKQMGASTGWTLAAVAGMASVPGIVVLLNTALSSAFREAFGGNESTLFGAIRGDMEHGPDGGNPLALLLIISALVVALAFAALVFMTRQPGILVFVCLAPLVLASLARGGDTSAVKMWAQRLLGLMFAPFALLLVAPFVGLASGSLVLDTVLLIAGDALMLRMIFHGVPYFGPRVARGVRSMVEHNTSNRYALAAVRAGAPDFYELESAPRGPRTVGTPRRAAGQDRSVLYAAYGIPQGKRPGRMTTEAAVASARRDETERARRATRINQARREARNAARPPATNQQPAPKRPANP